MDIEQLEQLVAVVVTAGLVAGNFLMFTPWRDGEDPRRGHPESLIPNLIRSHRAVGMTPDRTTTQLGTAQSIQRIRFKTESIDPDRSGSKRLCSATKNWTCLTRRTGRQFGTDIEAMKTNGRQHSLVESVLDLSTRRTTRCFTAEATFDQLRHPQLPRSLPIDCIGWSHINHHDEKPHPSSSSLLGEVRLKPLVQPTRAPEHNNSSQRRAMAIDDVCRKISRTKPTPALVLKCRNASFTIDQRMGIMAATA